MIFEFTGTAREFEEAKIVLNGKRLDALTVSNLAKHGIVEFAGEGTKPKRGRTPSQYHAVSRSGLVFSKE